MLVIRAAVKNRFSARIFVVVWAAIMVWPLLPFNFSADLSIYKFLPKKLSTTAEPSVSTVAQPYESTIPLIPGNKLYPVENSHYTAEIAQKRADAQSKGSLSTERIF